MDGVLICGVYGTGKSSLAAEIATLLERRGAAFGAIDLDWLTWFEVPDMDEQAARDVFLANLADVVGNYRSIGVRHLVLAGAVRDRGEVEALGHAVGFTLRVVRLDVPLETITRRLSAEPTTGRRDDLAVAERWLAESTGVGVEDMAMPNTGSVHDAALRIID
jgi:hypothetical protein